MTNQPRRVWRKTVCAAGPRCFAHQLRSVYAVAPISTDMDAPCVLHRERPSRPGDERHSAKPSRAPQYATGVAVRVRFAPSPTGFLHIGSVHTALFNWLFARHEGGEFRLRIENTDTSREVADATEQIQESLRWLGLDWDEEVTFQLDRMPQAQEVANRLVAEEKAY